MTLPGWRLTIDDDLYNDEVLRQSMAYMLLLHVCMKGGLLCQKQFSKAQKKVTFSLQQRAGGGLVQRMNFEWFFCSGLISFFVQKKSRQIKRPSRIFFHQVRSGILWYVVLVR